MSAERDRTNGEFAIRDERLAGIDRATELRLRAIEKIPDMVDEKVAHLADTVDVKLNAVQSQFGFLEERTQEQKSDTKAALDAALAAQKESVASQTTSSEKSIAKSEIGTIERIKAVETLLATSFKGIDDKIADIKDRVIAMEATKIGHSESGSESQRHSDNTRAMIATAISLVFLLIAVGSILVAIVKP